jgi:hypothetical protein
MRFSAKMVFLKAEPHPTSRGCWLLSFKQVEDSEVCKWTYTFPLKAGQVWHYRALRAKDGVFTTKFARQAVASEGVVDIRAYDSWNNGEAFLFHPALSMPSA